MPSVVCIVGRSGSGKTTLIEELIPELTARGFRVGTVKHSSHGFDMDREGKDTWRHMRSGSRATLIDAEGKLALLREPVEPMPLGSLVSRYLDGVDLVLAEGFKKEGMPKIEVAGDGNQGDLLTAPEEGLLAVVANDPGFHAGVPVFRPDDAKGIVSFLLARLPHSLPANDLDLEARFDAPGLSATRALGGLLGRWVPAILAVFLGEKPAPGR